MLIEIPSSISPFGISFGNIGIAVEAYRTVVSALPNRDMEIEFNIDINKDDRKTILKIFSNIWKIFSEGYEVKRNVKFEIKEYIPLHYGLGTLETFAIAFSYGLASINEIDLTDIELLTIASSALKEYNEPWDYLTASYYGGFIWVNPIADPPTLIKIDPPDWLELILLVPKQRQTGYIGKLRDIAKKDFSYYDVYRLTSRLSSLMQGLLNDDPRALREGLLYDETFLNTFIKTALPYYKDLIHSIKQDEYIGFLISRSGPSILLLIDGVTTDVNDIYNRILNNISRKGVPYEAIKTTIGGGLYTK